MSLEVWAERARSSCREPSGCPAPPGVIERLVVIIALNVARDTVKWRRFRRAARLFRSGVGHPQFPECPSARSLPCLPSIVSGLGARAPPPRVAPSVKAAGRQLGHVRGQGRCARAPGSGRVGLSRPVRRRDDARLARHGRHEVRRVSCAEGGGFEPPVRGHRTTVFKTVTFGRSVSPPGPEGPVHSGASRGWRAHVVGNLARSRDHADPYASSCPSASAEDSAGCSGSRGMSVACSAW